MSVNFTQNFHESGINVIRIRDDKFKSNYICIRLVTPIDAKKSPRNSLTIDLLTMSNSACPTREQLEESLADLYGVSLGSCSYRMADYQMCELSAVFLADDCTIGGEVISDKAAEILRCCIFEPHFENGCFSEKYFRIRKQSQLDAIRSIINEKRQYAMQRAFSEIFRGEPIALSTLGTIEETESITLPELTESYRDLLKNAAVTITIGGTDIPDSVCDMLCESFAKFNPHRDMPIDYYRSSPCKAETLYLSEQLDVRQCKLVMAFKSPKTNIYADKVMSVLLGGCPTSKLHINVREKLSLCYYCSARLIEGKGTLIVDSGLDKENIKTTQEEILRQLDAVASGDFTDEELENVKLLMCSAFRSNYDNLADIDDWYYLQMLRGTSYSPDEVCDILRALTREEIIESAKGFKPDTVYVLEPLQGGEKQ